MPDPVRQIVHVDLARGLPDLSGAADGSDMRVVWWWRDIPLGQDDLNHLGLPPRPLAERVAHRVAGPVSDRLGPHAGEAEVLSALDQLPRPEAPTASVVICTRDRPEALERCLRSIDEARDRPQELVVVDNGQSPATHEVVARFPMVRCVREPQPGLSAARNAGLSATSGEVVAFVDDDAEVHPHWLSRLQSAFADPMVMAAAGLVLPAELRTESQLVFESVLRGLGRGFRPRRFDAGFLGRLGVAPVWEVGAGCNMAIRRLGVELAGEFDERLGAGAAGCSEDSELLYRLLGSGWACVYEPASVVFHHHRADPQALHRQAEAYARGHLAALFVQFAHSRRPGNLIRACVRLPLTFALAAAIESVKQVLQGAGVTPRTLRRPVGAEIHGYLRGLAYLPLAGSPPDPRHKAARREFLGRNPYPEPLTAGFFYREKMRAVHSVAPDIPVRRALEIGGGQSGLARMLYPRAHVTNLDLDPAYEAARANRDPLVRFVQGDATALPFPDDSFDVVTLLDVLEHIPDDRAAAAEALRVTRPGGWILVSCPNRRWRSPYHAPMRGICPSSEQMMIRWQHVRVGYGIDELTSLFGLPPAASADFINPVTVVAHDVSFSRLRPRLRRAALLALSPVTWLGYLRPPGAGLGTETAASWRKPVR